MYQFKNILCSFIIFTLLGCGNPAPEHDPSLTRWPYGVWETYEGHSIHVFRDDTYKFCHKGKCENGKTREDRILIDFFKIDIAQEIIKETSADFFNDYDDNGNDLILFVATEHEGGIPPWEQKRACGNNPCFRLGAMDSGSYIFVKTRNY